MQLIIDLPVREDQLAFNRQRWESLLADRQLAELPFRIETNAYGQILMTPPASGRHSHHQGKITILLHQMIDGHVMPECPVSTIDGVKAVDVGWYSDDRFNKLDGQTAFEIAPEICVEILSPSNTPSEMNTKRQLNFQSGASEVWFCQTDGSMTYYHSDTPTTAQPNSTRCPNFPNII